MAAHDRIIAAIRKKFGDAAAQSLGEDAVSDVREVIPTGITVVDRYLLGVGGLPVGRMVEVYSEEGVGKAQPLDAAVLTPDGFVPIGQLKVGDVIVDPTTGGAQRVDGVYDRGVLDVYEVETSDGSRTRCCAEHLWRVSTPNDVVRGTSRVVDVATILRSGLREPHGSADAWRYRVPLTQPVEFTTDEAALPLDPYALGLLLGDGGFTGASVVFSKPEEDLVEALRAHLPSGDLLTKADGCSWRVVGATRVPSGSLTRRSLTALGLYGLRSEDKFVPPRYLSASPETRRAVLRGLADTDGYVSGGAVEFSTSSPRLADDVWWLARSLGGLAYRRSKIPTYSYRGERRTGLRSYTVRVVMADPPVSSRKHLARLTSRASATDSAAIVRVELVGRSEWCRCIKVSSEQQLYVTDDFVVTHNTSFAMSCVAGAQREGGVAVWAETEEALSKERFGVFGASVDEVVLLQPGSIEETGQQIEVALKAIPSGVGPNIVVWDSIAATPTRSEIKDGLTGDAKIGERARALSRICRSLSKLVAEKRAVLLFTNQVREKIGVMYGDPITTPGGHGVKFHSSVRIMLRRGKFVETTGADEPTGKGVHFRTTKCRTASPWRAAEVRLDFATGWDDAWSVLEHAKDRKLVADNARGAKALAEAMRALKWDAPAAPASSVVVEPEKEGS